MSAISWFVAASRRALAAASGEQLPGQSFALLGSTADGRGTPRDAIVRCLVVQHLGVSGHDGEQIVEVVGDAAGKPTDSFHSLGLVQCRFGALAFLDLELQASIDRLQVARSVIDHALDAAGIAGTEQQ
jgi:hypothetical protein